MLKKMITVAALASTLGAVALEPALADGGRHRAAAVGAAAGFVGGALVGSAINQNRYAPAYDDPQPVADCYYQRERVWDGDEYVYRRVRVCD